MVNTKGLGNTPVAAAPALAKVVRVCISTLQSNTIQMIFCEILTSSAARSATSVMTTLRTSMPVYQSRGLKSHFDSETHAFPQ